MLVYCVNDGAVMSAWGEAMGIEGSMITFLADTRSELTQALGVRGIPFPLLNALNALGPAAAVSLKALTCCAGQVVLDHPGPMAVLGNPRSKRFAMYLDDGVIKVFEVSEKPDDPAGDDFPESSCVENMLAQISKL